MTPSTSLSGAPNVSGQDGSELDVESTQRVRRIPVPPAAQRVCTLAHIDYADAFLVEIGRPQDRSAEQWARAIFDDAPASLRLRLWSVWLALGLKLAGPQSAEHVLGWEPLRSTSDLVLLGAASRIGMPAQLLVKRQEDKLLFDTFVEQKNLLARAVWAGIDTVHQRVVPSLLEQFRRRTNDSR